MKKSKKFGCMIGMLVLCLYGCGRNSEIYLEEYGENRKETEQTAEVFAKQPADADVCVSVTEEKVSSCYVYICGAVALPGVYALPEGSRIYEVIELAGGLTSDAADTLINQAELITDGMMLRIYTEAEAKEQLGKQEVLEEALNADGRIDINTAGISELMSLPGIGGTKAEAILSYRRENGDFSSIEDLMKVPGIKEGTFQQLKEHIKVNK